jgi:hypothetical protein
VAVDFDKHNLIVADTLTGDQVVVKSQSHLRRMHGNEQVQAVVVPKGARAPVSPVTWVPGTVPSPVEEKMLASLGGRSIQMQPAVNTGKGYELPPTIEMTLTDEAHTYAGSLPAGAPITVVRYRTKATSATPATVGVRALAVNPSNNVEQQRAALRRADRIKADKARRYDNAEITIRGAKLAGTIILPHLGVPAFPLVSLATGHTVATVSGAGHLATQAKAGKDLFDEIEFANELATGERHLSPTLAWAKQQDVKHTIAKTDRSDPIPTQADFNQLNGRATNTLPNWRGDVEEIMVATASFQTLADSADAVRATVLANGGSEFGARAAVLAFEEWSRQDACGQWETLTMEAVLQAAAPHVSRTSPDQRARTSTMRPGARQRAKVGAQQRVTEAAALCDRARMSDDPRVREAGERSLELARSHLTKVNKKRRSSRPRNRAYLSEIEVSAA